ncbi:MAG: bifunctional metallophosphatase/5'-nucleotidase [Bacteroidales bacterium]|jgi:2',3'-cyclic-nucleotide 2'-phosphodiesterase/3'-nucleotidase|nr:bifunctional metallophosphatase/5'-nucleotidase [Bacteroidales bacterium]
MKRNVLNIAAIVIALFGVGFGIGCLISLLSSKGSLADGEYRVTVCSTTDVHGAYFDSAYVDNLAAKTSLANVSSYLKEIRGEGVQPVLIDVGDNLQGDNAAYYFNYVATDVPHVYPRIAAYLGYDAIVVGNHDIETGHDVYDRVASELTMPYLAANAAFDRDENGRADMDENPDGKTVSDSYFVPYCVVDRGGVKVAIVGMTNGNIKSWLADDIWRGMDFQVISEMVQPVIDRMIEKEKPQLVVLAVHSGTGAEQPNRENEAQYLAATLRGVDIVLNGHDHRPLARDVENVNGGSVVLIDAGTKAVVVGQADFTLTVKNGKVVSKSVDYKLVPMEKYPVDPDYVAAFKEDFNAVKAFAQRPIGQLSENIFLADALDGPSTYINLVQTVQLASSGADISFAAPLTSSGVVPKGVIEFQDLVSIYKFENQLYVVEMTGKQIKDYLEYSYKNWVNKSGPSYNWDSADGIRYEVSRKAPDGERVKILSMNDGTPFDLDKTYKVAMTSYRASGGGDLVREGAGIDPASLVVVRKMKDIRSLIGDYIAAQKEIVPTVATNWKFVK